MFITSILLIADKHIIYCIWR